MGKDFEQYYRKSKAERIEILKSLNLYDVGLDIQESSSIFDHIVENFITTYEVPMGIAPNFLIENKLYHIPMATEEPSVIAGASKAANIIRQNGGFKVEFLKREMIGQIIFKNITDPIYFKTLLLDQTEKLFSLAKQAHPQIHELGGGLKSIDVEIKEHNFVTLYVSIDTLDAMGANTVNTILEYISRYFETTYRVETLMSILSNLSLNSLVRVSVSINPATLNFSDIIADNISQAYLYATIDPYRATTHNKGIMNGITALMLATGNDTRAVEAGCHAYASISGKYQPLTKWYKENEILKGEIEIPLTLGILGGSMNIVPKAKLSRKILGVSSAKELMTIAASLGLAQNFAALYALTTDGINKGHMRLHARNIAHQVTHNEKEIEEVINHMIEKNSINIETATKYIKSKK